MQSKWPLLGIVVFAIAVRLVVFWIDPHSDEPSEDSKQYHNLASNLVERGTLSTASKPPYHPSARRGPGYPLFLASIYSVLGPDVYAVKLIQCLLFGPAMCLLVYAIAQRSFANRRAGLWAAGVVALLPPLAEYCDRLMTEALFSVLLLASVYMTYRWVDTRNKAIAVGCGFLWGAMALVKPESTLLVFAVIPATVLIAARGSRRQLVMQSVLAMLVTAAVVGPWVYRNYRVLGKVALQAGTADERGGVQGGILHRYRVLYEQGLLFRPSRDPLRSLTGQDAKAAEAAYQKALKEPVADTSQGDVEFWLRHPGALATYSGIRLLALMRPASWSETFGLDRDFRYYITERQWPSLAGKGTMLLADVMVTLTGLCGLLLSLRPMHKRLWIMTASVAYFLAVYGLVHGVNRYRIPFVPLLVVLGVWWLYRVARYLYSRDGHTAQTDLA